MSLSTDAKERKDTPIFSGVLKYFPNALAEVARTSKAGNDQHNPGKPLHWDRSKSGDELDALSRHLLEAGTVDSDGIRHSAKVAWRALANLEKELEKAAKEEEDKKAYDGMAGSLKYSDVLKLAAQAQSSMLSSMSLHSPESAFYPKSLYPGSDIGINPFKIKPC